MTDSERWQFEYTHYALDAARELLHTPQLRRRMGALAGGLCEVAMNARAVLVIGGVAQPIEGYEHTEMIPVVGLTTHERATYSMVQQTPLQRAAMVQQQPDRRIPDIQEAVDAVAIPLGAQAVTYVPSLMTSYWNYSDGRRTMEVQYDSGRPIVGLLCDGAALGVQVLRLVHEFAHVQHAIEQPIRTQSASERSLSSELAAYSKEYYVARGIISPQSPMYRVAALVEAYRDIYNGPIESDTAFAANPQLMQRLANDKFDYWYHHG